MCFTIVGVCSARRTSTGIPYRRSWQILFHRKQRMSLTNQLGQFLFLRIRAIRLLLFSLVIAGWWNGIGRAENDPATCRLPQALSRGEKSIAGWPNDGLYFFLKKNSTWTSPPAVMVRRQQPIGEELSIIPRSTGRPIENSQWRHRQMAIGPFTPSPSIRYWWWNKSRFSPFKTSPFFPSTGSLIDRKLQKNFDPI